LRKARYGQRAESGMSGQMRVREANRKKAEMDIAKANYVSLNLTATRNHSTMATR
jgi:hypothetical protein